MAERGFSQRRACGGGADRPQGSASRVLSRAAEVLERLPASAAERRRFGYRCLGILLAHEGLNMNKKKLFRLCRSVVPALPFRS